MTDRNTGIGSIGNVHWGTHFCGFYGTREDLAATLIPYFATGLQEDEFCQWITSDPLTVEDATKELRRAIPDLDRYFDRKQMEIWGFSHLKLHFANRSKNHKPVFGKSLV